MNAETGDIIILRLLKVLGWLAYSFVLLVLVLGWAMFMMRATGDYSIRLTSSSELFVDPRPVLVFGGRQVLEDIQEYTVVGDVVAGRAGTQFFVAQPDGQIMKFSLQKEWIDFLKTRSLNLSAPMRRPTPLDTRIFWIVLVLGLIPFMWVILGVVLVVRGRRRVIQPA